MIRLHFPTVTGRATAWGIPINEAVERALACARELDVAREKAPAGEGFGERLTRVVQARVTSAMRPRAVVLANTAVAPKSEDESFAEKLKKECEKRSGQKQQRDYVEKERTRYRGLQTSAH
jgi:hypothetical protein